ncbi:trypsin-like peptidase domain-containing protein [Phytohabitans rumicis]|uniref:Uncharacterized protein n=1 Tax=Phytohabitans rumicis TaxID=1076125 RepID=A0A6V8L7D1_9ACTN|nr:trypsin-like peptidase domain-containing protein [Phytohabitans rumicis]GFJ93162.1 hypothetical protein Prum_068040 [Phytohabitans rumicis]
MTRLLAPAADPWTLAVHREEVGFTPIGAAVAISQRQALTCAHVVLDWFDDPERRQLIEPLWVSFPKVTSAWKLRRRVRRVEFDADDAQIADVAVLHLADDMPAGVEPARVKFLDPAVLAGRRWWAFGFPASSRRNGSEATGTVGPRLAHGWVRLDTDSPYPVEKGFSGGGLWLPDYDAVAAIVGQADSAGARPGDGQALTLAQADVFVPGAKLRVLAGWAAADAGAAAMAAWGWRLDEDAEAGRHWRPRGRGVMSDLERGYRFQGRTAALDRIVSWLDRSVPDQRALVVTGSPGVGKSAVLGRIVTTADARLRLELPDNDTGVVATVGSVGCAVHVKGKTALEVATEIARAAGVALPAEVEQLAPAIHELLVEDPRRFNIIIDAVDEAATEHDARAVLTGIVLPLVQGCGQLGAQVVCGSRRHDSAGELLRVLDGAMQKIDLDDSAFFSLEDLRAYTLGTLRLVGAERPGNPYTDLTVAERVAARIAALAEPNFLVAGLDARRHGMYDEVAADPLTLTLTATVDAALDAYLDRVPPIEGTPARAVLTALAHAEAPGWTSDLWRTAAVALGSTVTAAQLDLFARSTAASFLVEAIHADQESTFRLFHQALNDALLRERGPGGERADQRRLTRAMLAIGRDNGWDAAPPYLLRSLPNHAHRAGLIDALLTDDDYLLHADLLRLLPPAHRAHSVAARARTRLLSLTPHANAAPPPERAAMFSITQKLENLSPITHDRPIPYRARWARTRPRTEVRRLEGHTGRVNAVCAVTTDGRSLLASAGDDGTVRVWDPATGTELHRLEGHTSAVTAVCAVTADDRALIASAGTDQTVRTWDPATGANLRRIRNPTGPVNAMCAVKVDGHQRLASAGSAMEIRFWDPATGTGYRRIETPSGTVNTMCPIAVEGRAMLCTAGDDRTVYIWDPAICGEFRTFEGHTGTVNAACAITEGGRTLLATACNDWTVRLWDPVAGKERRFQGHTDWVRAVCTVTVDGKTLLATAGDDRTIRLWDPVTGIELRRIEIPASTVNAMCVVPIDGHELLATACDDGSVRLWEPAAGAEPYRFDGHTGTVNALCVITVDRPLLASTSDDRLVSLWDPTNGSELRRLEGHAGAVTAACSVTAEGRTRLATAGDDGTVRVWDPITGTQLRHLEGHTGTVNAVSAVTVGIPWWPALATTAPYASGIRQPAASYAASKATLTGSVHCAP